MERRDGSFGIGAIISLMIAVWVIADSVQRGKSGLEAVAWGLGVFCCCLLGLPLYLLNRGSDNRY